MSIGANIKKKRLEADMTLEELANIIGISRQTMSRYETGIINNIPSDKIEQLAEILHTTPAFLMGWEENAMLVTEQVFRFPVIGSISAGYDGDACEQYTGEVALIPAASLHGRPAADYFLLKVKGDSMYPQFMDGDRVLVLRCASVDSGSIAVVLYNGSEATLKKVNYVYGEDWMELMPINPEYKPKRIEGNELQLCKVLGKVVQLIREV